jgi:hypothetical protein
MKSIIGECFGEFSPEIWLDGMPDKGIRVRGETHRLNWDEVPRQRPGNRRNFLQLVSQPGKVPEFSRLPEGCETGFS